MNIFGFKAFLRAIAIFVSVYLVKTGIEMIPQANDTFIKIIFTMVMIVVVLLINIIPSIIPPNKRKDSVKDRNSKK